jgi:CubicO group peptidase (beta-lactamase class C family)
MHYSGFRHQILHFIVISKILICALALVMLLAPITASAQQKASAPNLTAADLEPWLNGFMTNALRVNEVQGAVVAVVKDGKIIVQKGYGYADAANRIPVDPVNTMFRPASISKLFVWTSVMQLVEQGKIDLDADINTYLDFKIAGMGGKKITVRHLMTHRAGFEDIGKVGYLSDAASLKPLGSFLKDYVPKRIFVPGSTPAYSNYGTALAGYIVQRVSGMPFETYVERNIFTQLGMTHSTFRQPLPRALQSFMSKGYQVTGGEPQPFELMNDAPAGALSASSADMVKFMVAHLEAERASGGKLLKPETARLMHRSVIKSFPRLNGMALGFAENNINGHKVIGHGGDLNLFHSNLSLFIDDDIGIYISMNNAGNGGMDVRSKLLAKFADRYMPAKLDETVIDKATAKLHLQQIVGAYISTRRLESSSGRLANLLGEVSLSADDQGILVFTGFGRIMRFQEIRPYLWRQVDGKEMLSVKMNGTRPLSMSFDLVSPDMEFTPVPFMASASAILPALFASIAILMISLLSWPLGFFANRLYGVARNQKANERHLFLTRQVASICLIVGGISWVILLAKGLSSGLTDADNTHILFTQASSIICVLIAGTCIFVVARGLFKTKQSRLTAFGTAIWLAASVFVIWFYYSFNFLKIGVDF